MISQDKIDEWLKEIQARPESAALIIQFVANRLRDLSARNEKLLEENIALVSGKRVEEYEQRIAYLEYQLDLLKRQVGGDALTTGSSQGSIAMVRTGKGSQPETNSVLLFNHRGRVLRLEASFATVESGVTLARLKGEPAVDGEAPGMLVVRLSDELLFVFSSGRAATLPATQIPEAEGESLDWGRAAIPHEPVAGDRLACLAPVSRLTLSEFFIQTSRRGYVKRLNTSMAQSILANRFIGTGVRLPADKTFGLALCDKDDRLCLLSHLGYLLVADVKGLSFSSEEAIRLGATDHLVSALIAPAGVALLVMTQIGKLLQVPAENLEVSDPLRTRGKPLYSAQRREKGVRVISAGFAGKGGWALALHRDGPLTAHRLDALTGAGSIPVQSEILAFTVFHPGGM